MENTAPPPAPGLREQFGATRAAAVRLVAAHVELAKADAGEILEQVKRVAILAGLAVAALVVLGFLLPIGLALFLGELLFGSIGWGVLHGTLLLVGVAVIAAVAAIDRAAGRLGRSTLLAAALGIAVGLVLGLDLSNRAWVAVGDSLGLAIDPAVRPLAVAMIVLGVVGGLLGLVSGARSGGGGGAVAGLLVGAVLGALLGGLSAIALGPRVGAAIGLTAALIAWPALVGLSLARHGIDTKALKARFWPSATIETTKETIEWVRERTPLGPKS